MRSSSLHKVRRGANLQMDLQSSLHQDERGELLALALNELDFDPVRLFVVSGSEGAIRGGHGPAEGQQLIMLLSGQVNFCVEDAGKERLLIQLDSVGDSIQIDNTTVCWQGFPTSKGLLLLLSDTSYDPDKFVYPEKPLTSNEEEWLRSP